jgi:hypothetical protein
MRGAALLLVGPLLMLVPGCSAEPDFDTRFDQRSRELADKARRIEADANAQLAAAREAEKAEAERNGTAAVAGR